MVIYVPGADFVCIRLSLMVCAFGVCGLFGSYDFFYWRSRIPIFFLDR